MARWDAFPPPNLAIVGCLAQLLVGNVSNNFLGNKGEQGDEVATLMVGESSFCALSVT